MLNVLGINSNAQVKLVLGALLIAIGVIQSIILLIAIGALVLGSALMTRQRSRRRPGGNGSS